VEGWVTYSDVNLRLAEMARVMGAGRGPCLGGYDNVNDVVLLQSVAL
jgi:hypothetical protein